MLKDSKIYVAELHRVSGIRRLPVLVSKNTRTLKWPWRLSVFNEADTEIVLPHISLLLPPKGRHEVLRLLENQFRHYSGFEGGLRVVAA